VRRDPISNQKDEFVVAKIAKMSLLEKYGLLLTFTWQDVCLTPSGIEQATEPQASGLCRNTQFPNGIFQFYFGIM
jgi:hypothetical protein